MLGEGITQGSPGPGEARPPAPALAPHHHEVEVEPPLLPEEERELPHRHPVANGEVVQPAEALEAGGERRPLHRQAADGVGAVEDDEAEVRLGGRLHAEHHRRLVGVVASAHVLDVEAERVEAFEPSRAGAQRRGGPPVERVGREPGAAVALVRHRRHVLGVAPDAVLRAEEGGEPQRRGRGEHVGRVPQPAVHGGGVADEPHAHARERAEPPPRQHLEAGHHLSARRPSPRSARAARSGR